MLAEKLSVKLYAHDPAAVDLAGFIPIFHRWIQESRLPGRLLIDVADYRHIANGPGVVLIAHQAHYALDSEHGPLGLTCSQRRDSPGELGDKLTSGFRDALTACRHLEDDPLRPIRFRTDRMRVAILSRRFAPSSEATWEAAEPALTAFAARLYPGLAVGLEPSTDLRAPFAVDLLAPEPPSIATLLGRLDG